MIRELKDEYDYTRVILSISALSFVFGFALCFLGEIVLPLASSFLAILFLFEQPKKRIFSYLCPTLSIGLGVLLKGLAAIVAIEYVLIAFVIAFCYKKSLSKAEASIYLTLTIAVFVFLSLYLGAATTLETFSLTEIKNHYVKLYVNFRREIINTLSSIMVTAEDGAVQNAMSVEDASLYFNTFTNSFIALVGIASFLLTGLTLKLYARLVLKYSKHGILKSFAHFLPSNFCAYAYVISSLLGILSSQTSTFGIVLVNVNTIMTVVFAYMGFKYLFMVAKLSNRKTLIYLIIVFGFVSFPTVAPSVISYLGVWVVLGTNSHNKISKAN